MTKKAMKAMKIMTKIMMGSQAIQSKECSLSHVRKIADVVATNCPTAVRHTQYTGHHFAYVLIDGKAVWSIKRDYEEDTKDEWYSNSPKFVCRVSIVFISFQKENQNTIYDVCMFSVQWHF